MYPGALYVPLLTSSISSTFRDRRDLPCFKESDHDEHSSSSYELVSLLGTGTIWPHALASLSQGCLPYASNSVYAPREAASSTAPSSRAPYAQAASSAPPGSISGTVQAYRRQSRAARATSCSPDPPRACSLVLTRARGSLAPLRVEGEEPRARTL